MPRRGAKRGTEEVIVRTLGKARTEGNRLDEEEAKKPDRTRNRTNNAVTKVAKAQADLLKPNPANEPIVNFMSELVLLPIIRHDDPDRLAKMEERFVLYLQMAAERKMKVGNMAAYLALNTDMHTVNAWASGKNGKEYQDFARRVKSVCAAYREAMMSDGTLPTIAGIFWQKNHDEFQDKKEISYSSAEQSTAGASEEELSKRYGNVIDVEYNEKKSTE